MNIIVGNYGNHTLAVMRWVYEKKLPHVFVVNIDTGWAETTWRQRVAAGQCVAEDYGFHSVTLSPSVDFAEMVRDRGQFPSKKFQWCVSFLKALPLLEWLDEIDPACEATILLGSRRADSRSRTKLAEFDEKSEYYNRRKIWRPLSQHSDEQWQQLIAATGLKFLSHRSLECDPCIHSPKDELITISVASAERLVALEKELGKPMFEVPINQCAKPKKDGLKKKGKLECLDVGCGSFYACGE